MSELEYLKGQLADTEDAIIREEKKETAKKHAEELHDIYQAYLNAGFTDERAWWLVGNLFYTAINS